MTITVGAGTPVAEIVRVLGDHGQECALDPRDTGATVGGALASGLSGVRRLRHGPIRDQVLEVRFVTGDGRVVKGGGPTVKNVTGYDLPRLMVGSLGTLGVLAQATLRCRPRAQVAKWFAASEPPTHVYRPAAMLWNEVGVFVRCEGNATDVDAQGAGLDEAEAPALPEGAHRGRISVAPGAMPALVADLADIRWCAELGVGTVHVAADSAGALEGARAAAHAHGGWMLREAGGDGMDPFGGSSRTARSCIASRPPSIRRGSSHQEGCRFEAARSRRRRARRLRRVRPVPAALPDVPRHRPRDRVSPWPDRGDARGRPARRRDRRHVLARDGRVRPVPRLRSRVPFRRAVRPSDGGHPRRAPHAAPHPKRAARARMVRVQAPAPVALAAARGNVGPRRRAEVAPRPAPIRSPAHLDPQPAPARRRRRRSPGRVALHRMRHGRVDA